MKAFLYILLISGIVPATFMFFQTLMMLFLFISDTDFSLIDILIMISFLFGLCGYIGLLITLKGLHNTNHLKKLILIGLGLIGFTMFFNIAGTKNFWNWVLKIEEPDEWFLGIWPILVSIVFLIMIGFDYIKMKKLNTVANNG